MGLILDTNIFVRAERAHDTAERLFTDLLEEFSDQEFITTEVVYSEIVEGIYRAKTAKQRADRQEFIASVFEQLPVLDFTKPIAEIAGRISGERAALGDSLPWADIAIAATAIYTGFAVLTHDLKHFSRMPGVQIVTPKTP